MKTHTLWSRKRDLNPYKQLGRLLCYRYTIPADAPDTSRLGAGRYKKKEKTVRIFRLTVIISCIIPEIVPVGTF